MERHAAQVAQRLHVQQVLWKQDQSVSLFLLDDLKMTMMDVSYLGEGWLDFAVFIPPARKNSVKAEYVRRINVMVPHRLQILCATHSRMPWALSSSLLLVELMKIPSSSRGGPVVEDRRLDLALRPLHPTLYPSLQRQE